MVNPPAPHRQHLLDQMPLSARYRPERSRSNGCLSAGAPPPPRLGMQLTPSPSMSIVAPRPARTPPVCNGGQPGVLDPRLSNGNALELVQQGALTLPLSGTTRALSSARRASCSTPSARGGSVTPTYAMSYQPPEAGCRRDSAAIGFSPRREMSVGPAVGGVPTPQ